MMKWRLVRPFFIPQASTLLSAADGKAFANEWFSAKRSVEKLQGVVNPVAALEIAAAAAKVASATGVAATEAAAGVIAEAAAGTGVVGVGAGEAAVALG